MPLLAFLITDVDATRQSIFFSGRNLNRNYASSTIEVFRAFYRVKYSPSVLSNFGADKVSGRLLQRKPWQSWGCLTWIGSRLSLGLV